MTKKLKFYDSVFSQEKELETKILVSFDEEEISRDSFSKFLSWFEKDEQQMVIGLYESLPKEDKEDFLKLLKTRC
jgi:acyl-CoA synthetase (NDP forming)